MVVLTLKNLQQQSFSVDIDLLCSVKELKEKIEKENGPDYPSGGQKLIYAGKILQDDSNLQSYNIDTKKFLVIMVTKPKGPPPSSEPSDPTVTPTAEAGTTTQAAAATSDSLPSVASVTSSDSTTTSTVTTPNTSTTSPSTAAPPSETSNTRPVDNAESVIVMGEEFNRMVENIMEMGYERSKVEQALRASFNNPYTAVQYLVDGIPQNLELGPGSDGSDAPGGDVALREGPEGEEDDPLAFLRNQPQFTEMRQMIRSNPQLLDAFIQQIGGTNPELLQVIQQNQDAFVRMLNEGQESATTAGRVGSALSSNPPPSSGSNPSGQPSRGQQIMVSPQDKEAIERLKALGNFPEDVVIQAYFACEKNENLAAEFLFSQSWD